MGVQKLLLVVQVIFQRALDRLGVLRVGPQSAGADPGPACYGKGGQEPTVTDADLILGYLDPDYFFGD